MLRVFRVFIEKNGAGKMLMINSDSYLSCVDHVKAEYPEHYIIDVLTSKSWRNYRYN